MLATVDTEEITTETQCLAPAVDQASEAKLSGEITALWSAHQDGKATAKRTKEDLKAIRRDLGERLHAMKTLLARTGRGGQWTSYLREHKISRTTADRWSREHEESRNPGSTKRTDGAISEPTRTTSSSSSRASCLACGARSRPTIPFTISCGRCFSSFPPRTAI